jgi:ABC-2 type transport system permease protein
MASVSGLAGVFAYEFRMQVRRRSVWLVLGVLGAYMLRVLIDQTGREPGDQLVAEWAWLLQVLCPIALGILLADRFARDRRVGVDQILETSPVTGWLRLLGKYLGATAATIVPIVIVYAIGVVYIAGSRDAAAVAALALPAFGLICLPGLLFVAAYSVCVPIVMKVPLYQFLFVGYWFWGNLMPPQIMPTLRDTWLSPIGTVAEQAFFGVFTEGQTPDWQPIDGLMSISVLLAGAIAALLAGVIALRLQRSRV